VQKLLNFLKLMVCSHGQGGGSWASADICVQGGGINFSRFCVDVFYGRPLIVLKTHVCCVLL